MNHHFNVIRRHRNPLLLLNLILLFGTLLSATVLANIWSPPVWKARAEFNLPNSGGNLNADLGTLGSLRDSTTGFSREVSPLQIQSTIITSDAVMEKTWSIDPEKEAFPSFGSLKGLFTVEPLPQSSIISVEAQGSSPELALGRVRNLTKAYQQRLDELRSSDADSRQEFAQKELKLAKDDLLEAQRELAQFRLITGIVDSGGQTQQLVSSINELRTRLTLVQSEAEASRTRAEVAASHLNTTPEKAIQSLNLAENQEYQEVRQKLAETEIELSEARSQYTDASPQVQNLLFEREQLVQDLAKRVSAVIPGSSRRQIDLTLGGDGSSRRLDMISELIAAQTTSQGLQQQTIQIQNQIAKLTNELDAISANGSKLVELERKYNIAEGVYNGIIAQINQTKIDNFNSYPNVQLIDGPTLDPQPETPSKTLILLGGVLASLFGSFSLLLFLESSAPLLSPKDLMLVEYPILFSIAHFKKLYIGWDSISNRQLQQASSESPEEENSNAREPRLSDLSSSSYDGVVSDWQYNYNYSAEQEFERLATIFRSLVLENRRIMITSATAGEGKTTITLGLAIALRKLGFRVLVVDSDLQRCSLSKHLGIVPERRKAEDDQIQPIVNLSYGLDLLAAPAVPRDETVQFCAKGNFERYLERAQAEGDYDYVLVDTSPVHLTSESMLIAPSIENVLFVVRPGISDRHAVMNSLEQLKLHKAQIKGLILNGVNASGSSYRYSYKSQLAKTLVAEQVASY
ncbi:MAG: P-loop NTPase [Xenococcaceae cyanobacterium MO_188.B32]|nr:P-loop NTPase [Xenococcaceae cyanobacterium MO_188.B32]